MKKLLILLTISALFASCKKEESLGYDNTPLSGNRYQTSQGFYKLEFTSTECVERVYGLPETRKTYFLVNNEIHYYGLDNKAFTKIQILNNGDMLYNLKPNNTYDYYFQKY